MANRISEQLDRGMDMPLHKPGKRASAVACSSSGELYVGVSVRSQTKLLDMSAEQVALLHAAQHGDTDIKQLVALHEDDTHSIDPIIYKVMADFASRQGIAMKYRRFSTDSDLLVGIDNVAETYGGYQPPDAVIDVSRSLEGNSFQVSSRTISAEELSRFAALGTQRAFLADSGGSRYGSAVQSGDRVYVSGQYSSFEGRTNIHAEVGALLAAHLDGATDVVQLSVVSDKNHTDPTTPCGCCRQFMTEQCGPELQVHSASFDAQSIHSMRISELLPSAWTSEEATR